MPSNVVAVARCNASRIVPGDEVASIDSRASAVHCGGGSVRDPRQTSDGYRADDEQP